MAYRKSLLACCLLILCSTVFAKSKFLLAVEHDVDFTQFRHASSLYLFDDGTYFLRSTSGDFSFCSSETGGEFKGKVDKKLLESFKQGLQSLEKECASISTCSAGSSNEFGGNRWTVTDFSGKKAQPYVMEDADLPSLVYTAMDAVPKLAKDPLIGLQVAAKKKKGGVEIKFTNKGKQDLSLYIDEGNFFVNTQNGGIRPASEYFDFHIHSAKLILPPGATRSVRARDKKKVPSDPAAFVIYDNSTTAHHGSDGHIFSICSKI